MGFFIGWKHFNDNQYYSEDAVNARNEYNGQIAANQRAAEKARKKKQERRRIEKQKIRDEQYKQTTEYQELFNQAYGASGNPAISADPNDPYALYKKYSVDNKENYRDETQRRYGYLYNSYTDGETPNLSRGLGVNPHQGVKTQQKANPHSALGPMSRRIRISIGWQPNAGGQNSQSVAATKMDDAPGGGSFGGGSGGGKLGRPF